MESVLGLFANGSEIVLKVTEDPKRKKAPASPGGPLTYVFSSGEDITGTADIQLKPGKSLDHQGVTVEFIGRVVRHGNIETNHDFQNVTKDLAPAGKMMKGTEFNWSFKAAELMYESFAGQGVTVKYFIRCTLKCTYLIYYEEVDILCQNLSTAPAADEPLEIKTGIGDVLQVKVECAKKDYHMRDVIVGRVSFDTIDIKVKHMEVNIVRKETVGIMDSSKVVQNDVIAKYEIMDGTPTPGTCLPLRMHLKGLGLTPTMPNVQNIFSVTYQLRFVVIGHDDMKYQESNEIVLYRTRIG